MTYRFAAMGHDEQLVAVRGLHNRCEQFDIAEPVALSMRKQLAKPAHTCLGAAFQFIYRRVASRWQQHSHTVDAAWITAHGVNDIAIGLRDQRRFAPAKRKGYRDIYAGGVHFCYQVFGVCHRCAWVTVELAEPGVARAILFALLLYFRRKEERMQIDKHDY